MSHVMEIHAERIAQAWASIREIYADRALKPYGLSGVNQQQHALQAATLALKTGCPDSLVVAALLHDVGHMIHTLGEHPAADGIDDSHEAIGAAWLERFFGPAVCEPVRMHVDAKRYLCAVEPGYFNRLSADSVESLLLQGGPMSFDEKLQFEQKPFYQDAVHLRRMDEQAKQPDAVCMPLETFFPVIARLVKVGRSEPTVMGPCEQRV